MNGLKGNVMKSGTVQSCNWDGITNAAALAWGNETGSSFEDIPIYNFMIMQCRPFTTRNISKIIYVINLAFIMWLCNITLLAIFSERLRRKVQDQQSSKSTQRFTPNYRCSWHLFRLSTAECLVCKKHELQVPDKIKTSA